VVGVFVPVRHTDARLAVAVGGRWFPGVHAMADLDVQCPTSSLAWTLRADECTVAVAVDTATRPSDLAACPVAETCLGATVGLSPDRRGRLEGVQMRPAHRHARVVVVNQLESSFLAGFTTAQPAPAYLMEDVAVTWRPTPAPRSVGVAA
jgi:hypothetical protein